MDLHFYTEDAKVEVDLYFFLHYKICGKGRGFIMNIVKVKVSLYFYIITFVERDVDLL